MAQRTIDTAMAARHRLYEDALAMLLGAMLVSLGVALYGKATLVTGGVAGLALLLEAAGGPAFSVGFFLANLPFYWLAWQRMGRAYTLRTFIAVALVSGLSWATPRLVRIEAIDPIYAAIAGGSLMGIGMLVLFRHRTGLGGVNVLAAWLQERHGLRAGWLQLGIDVAILAAAALVLPLDRVGLSLLGAVALNLNLAINHRPGRYLGVT